MQRVNYHIVRVECEQFNGDATPGHLVEVDVVLGMQSCCECEDDDWKPEHIEHEESDCCSQHSKEIKNRTPILN